MKKCKGIIAVTIMLVVLSLLSIAAYSSNEPSKVENSEIVRGDHFAAGETVGNSGTIKGDFFAAGSTASNQGTVEGDLISTSSEINMPGKILGNMRVLAGKAVISGNIAKNVNIISGDTNITDTSSIGGNLIAFCGNTKVGGRVSGNTRIDSHDIELSGEFFGDVDINMDGPDKINDDRGPQTTLTVLPTAVIHGKLTYKGLSEANIQDGAKINSFQWVKPAIDANGKKSSTVFGGINNFIRFIFSTALYFLLGVLIYKTAPVIFKRQGEIISTKPLNVFGAGIAALFAIPVLLIVLIILVLLSIGLIYPSFMFIFGVIVSQIYILLFYFSTIPVSVWLGNLLLKDRFTPLKRFAFGLSAISIGLFLIKSLSGLTGIGIVFKIFSAVATFSIEVMGIGALLYSIRVVYAAVKRYEEIL